MRSCYPDSSLRPEMTSRNWRSKRFGHFGHSLFTYLQTAAFYVYKYKQKKRSWIGQGFINWLKDARSWRYKYHNLYSSLITFVSGKWQVHGTVHSSPFWVFCRKHCHLVNNFIDSFEMRVQYTEQEAHRAVNVNVTALIIVLNCTRPTPLVHQLALLFETLNRLFGTLTLP